MSFKHHVSVSTDATIFGQSNADAWDIDCHLIHDLCRDNLNFVNDDNLMIQTLMRQRILRRAKKRRLRKSEWTRISKLSTTKRGHGSLVEFIIMPNCIVLPHKHFKFSFDLYFYYDPIIAMSRHSNMHDRSSTKSKHNSEYIYYTFEVNYEQLQKLHSLIIESADNGTHFFPSQKYPQPMTPRNRRLMKRTEMEFESKYFEQPLLPNCKSFWVRSSTQTHLFDLTKYLQCLFSSLSLLIQPFFFEHIVFADREMVEFIQKHSLQKLFTMAGLAKDAQVLIFPKRLSKKTGPAFVFHSVYVVRRPLDRADLGSFTHWAIKFEGHKHLLTIEFFGNDNDNNNNNNKNKNKKSNKNNNTNESDNGGDDHRGVVHMRLLTNRPMNRRLFWFWWSTENDYQFHHQHSQHQNNFHFQFNLLKKNHALKRAPKKNNKYFNHRWQVLYKCDAQPQNLNCYLIGKYIEKWIQMPGHTEYNIVINNCQHFVRDIMAIIDLPTAVKLNKRFDRNSVIGPIPGMQVAAEITDKIDTGRAFDALRPISREFERNPMGIHDDEPDAESIATMDTDQNLQALRLFFEAQDGQRAHAQAQKQRQHEHEQILDVGVGVDVEVEQ